MPSVSKSLNRSKEKNIGLIGHYTVFKRDKLLYFFVYLLSSSLVCQVQDKYSKLK